MHAQKEQLANKLVYFVRTNAKGVSEKAPEVDMAAGEIHPDSLQSYRTLLTELYMPLLSAQDALGKATNQQSAELLQARGVFAGQTRPQPACPLLDVQDEVLGSSVACVASRMTLHDGMYFQLHSQSLDLLASMTAYAAECTSLASQGGTTNGIKHCHSAQGCLIRGPVSPGPCDRHRPNPSLARAQAATAFTLALDEAVGAMHGAVEAAMPDAEIIAGIEAKPQALSKAAGREPVLSHCNGVLEGWASQAAALLAVGSPPAAVRGFLCLIPLTCVCVHAVLDSSNKACPLAACRHQ